MSPRESVSPGPEARCATVTHMAAEVTVRELRQNLSVYLRRVERGETLAVTRRGEPVAVLAPLPERRSALDRLVAQRGAVRPAGDLLAHGAPLPTTPGEPSISEVLERQRTERLP